MIICGVDPGFSGALALIEGRQILGLYDMPILKNKKNEVDLQGLADILVKANDVYIEKAQTMPGQGISSSGRYMESFGMIQGICVGLKIPYLLVTPQRWKKEMLPDMVKGKEASIIMAQRLFPDLKMPRKKDHGKCDALMIALYGQQRLGRIGIGQ